MVTELDLMSVFQLQRVNSSLPFFFSRETNGFGVVCPDLTLIGGTRGISLEKSNANLRKFVAFRVWWNEVDLSQFKFFLKKGILTF